MSYTFQIPSCSTTTEFPLRVLRDLCADLSENSIVDGFVPPAPPLRFRPRGFASHSTEFLRKLENGAVLHWPDVREMPPPDTVRIDGPITIAPIDWRLDGTDTNFTLDVSFDGVLSINQATARLQRLGPPPPSIRSEAERCVGFSAAGGDGGGGTVRRGGTGEGRAAPATAAAPVRAAAARATAVAAPVTAAATAATAAAARVRAAAALGEGGGSGNEPPTLRGLGHAPRIQSRRA